MCRRNRTRQRSGRGRTPELVVDDGDEEEILVATEAAWRSQSHAGGGWEAGGDDGVDGVGRLRIWLRRRPPPRRRGRGCGGMSEVGVGLVVGCVER